MCACAPPCFNLLRQPVIRWLHIKLVHQLTLFSTHTHAHTHTHPHSHTHPPSQQLVRQSHRISPLIKSCSVAAPSPSAVRPPELRPPRTSGSRRASHLPIVDPNFRSIPRTGPCRLTVLPKLITECIRVEPLTG